MKELLIDILLGLSAVLWVGSILVNLSLQLHYSTHKEGFVSRLVFKSLKMDYSSIADEMTPRDKKLYLGSFIGMFLFFLPGGYFVGNLLHNYLN